MYESKGPKSSKARFPTLKLFNPDLKLNPDGKIISTHRYKYSGSPTELVFFNGFIGYVERQESATPVLLDEVRMEYNKKAGISDEAGCKNCYVVKRAKFVREAERDQIVGTRK